MDVVEAMVGTIASIPMIRAVVPWLVPLAFAACSVVRKNDTTPTPPSTHAPIALADAQAASADVPDVVAPVSFPPPPFEVVAAADLVGWVVGAEDQPTRVAIASTSEW